MTTLLERITINPEISHGKPTIRGTRVMVWQVLDLVAKGMDWDEISHHWPATISKEAIAEAVSFANQVFVENAQEYQWELEPV